MTTTVFRPGPDTTRAFRNALGCFGTGVTIVTCRDAQGPLAMTANSFSSVSLDPPLVLWCVAKSSARHDSFVAAQAFGIHVLQDGQTDLAKQLARDGRGLPATAANLAVPTLPDYLVRFECSNHAVHDAGDHTIILGQVEHVSQGHGAPLLFTQGQFGGFKPETLG